MGQEGWLSYSAPTEPGDLNNPEVQCIPIPQTSQLRLRDIQKLARVIQHIGGRAGLGSKSLWPSYYVCVWGGMVHALKRPTGRDLKTCSLVLASLPLHYMILGKALLCLRPQCFPEGSELTALWIECMNVLVYSFPRKGSIALMDIQRDTWAPKMLRTTSLIMLSNAIINSNAYNLFYIQNYFMHFTS